MKKTTLYYLAFLWFSSIAYAQKVKTYTTKVINGPIAIDGDIDEAAWSEVDWAGRFVQTEPGNGAEPTFDTQFKLMYDHEHLYVAIMAFDDHPNRIVVSDEPRDFFAGDYVEINIDSDFDRKDAFSFTVTAGGIRGDEH
ncbi:MAG: sugar-binding protein, partial [Bacteroidota bacterium]